MTPDLPGRIPPDDDERARELKQAKEALWASELRFRTCFERSPIGMSLQNPEGRFLMVNPALCQMLGRNEADLRDLTLAEVCHPDFVETNLAAMAQLLSGQTESLQLETQWLCSEGGAVIGLMHISLVRRSTGEADYFFVQVQDITRIRHGERRVAAIAELRRSVWSGVSIKALMEEAVRAVTTGLDMECAVVYTGSGPDDLVLAAGLGHLGDSRRARMAQGDKPHACFKREPGEAVLGDPDGETRDAGSSPFVDHGLLSSASVVINVRGRPYGVLAAHSTRIRWLSASDVDFAQAVADLLGRAIERRDHEEAQESLHQQERLAAVGQLAAGVAHDFNNIVSAVGLYTDLLESRQSFDEAGRGHLDAIRKQVERATSLVWQVLDFAHRSPLAPVDVDLGAFLTELKPVLGRALPGTVTWTVVDEGGPYVVSGDPTRLQQIFLNLATNARDALDGRGELTITLSFDDSPPAMVAPDAAPHGPDDRRWVRITIADSGCGMSPDVRARVFEPFFTTKPPGNGTGLGMSQVHGLVTQHGGHIMIESSSGEGTTVAIWLPAVDRRPTTEETGLVDVGPATGERLLVVDDDPAIRGALGEVLESLGYTVTLAADGEAALELLERDRASLSGLVSDVLMPGMGGEELARVVTRRCPEMPVILISGDPTAGLRGEARPEGAVPPALPAARVLRLGKPFGRDELAEMLRVAITRAPEADRSG